MFSIAATTVTPSPATGPHRRHDREGRGWGRRAPRARTRRVGGRAESVRELEAGGLNERLLATRRPGVPMVVSVRVLRQVYLAAPVGVHHVDLVVAVAAGDEGDLLAPSGLSRVWVSPKLTGPSVTMRNLRRCRQLWAARNGPLPPPSWPVSSSRGSSRWRARGPRVGRAADAGQGRVASRGWQTSP